FVAAGSAPSAIRGPNPVGRSGRSNRCKQRQGRRRGRRSALGAVAGDVGVAVRSGVNQRSGRSATRSTSVVPGPGWSVMPTYGLVGPEGCFGGSHNWIRFSG